MAGLHRALTVVPNEEMTEGLSEHHRGYGLYSLRSVGEEDIYNLPDTNCRLRKSGVGKLEDLVDTRTGRHYLLNGF